MATERLQAIAERILRKQNLRLVTPQSSPRVLGARPDESGRPGRKANECVRCGGAGYVVAYFDAENKSLPVVDSVVPDYHHSGAIECRCKKTARYRTFHLSIPPQFRRANLARLSPRLDKHPSQAEIIQDVKAHPHDSYLFCGRNRAGKSHIGWCLARHAYLSGYRVVECNLSMLLDEYRAMEKPVADEDSIPRRPRILSGDLEVRGVRYCLFLQEFDKPRPTLYAAEKLFDLIDAAFNYQHQIIITTNLSVLPLSNHWSEHGARYGVGIVSRILERCNEVNMF